MTETTARTYHTMESLRQMAQTDLRNVNRKELVDINEVEIRKDLSQRERMVDFISQIKNPYCYLDKGIHLLTNAETRNQKNPCYLA